MVARRRLSVLGLRAIPGFKFPRSLGFEWLAFWRPRHLARVPSFIVSKGVSVTRYKCMPCRRLVRVSPADKLNLRQATPTLQGALEAQMSALPMGVEAQHHTVIREDAARYSVRLAKRIIEPSRHFALKQPSLTHHVSSTADRLPSTRRFWRAGTTGRVATDRKPWMGQCASVFIRV